MSHSLISIYQYTELASNIEKIRASWKELIQLSISRTVYKFQTVTTLRLQYWARYPTESFSLGATKFWLTHYLSAGSIALFWSSLNISFVANCFSLRPTRYKTLWTGLSSLEVTSLRYFTVFLRPRYPLHVYPLLDSNLTNWFLCGLLLSGSKFCFPGFVQPCSLSFSFPFSWLAIC